MYQPCDRRRFPEIIHRHRNRLLLLQTAALLLLSHSHSRAAAPAYQPPSMATPVYGTPTFPCPPELVPWVAFWLRIFTEFTSIQRVLHDSRYPWVIHGVVDVAGLSPAQANVRVQERRAWYGLILESLALGSHRELTEAHKRVAATVSAVPEQAGYTRARGRMRSRTGISDMFRAGLVRSGRYMHEIEAILDSLGVPKEIAFSRMWSPPLMPWRYRGQGLSACGTSPGRQGRCIPGSLRPTACPSMSSFPPWPPPSG